MEHLETQVSDLRSFLPGTLQSPVAIPPGAGLVGPMAGTATTSVPTPVPVPVSAGGGVVGGVVAGGVVGHMVHGAQQHNQGQAYARPSSALHGANSAHPSPSSTIATPTASSFFQASSSQTPHTLRRTQGASASPAPSGSAGPGAAGAGAKRRADASAEESAQKQQRSKRNRVRFISFRVSHCCRFSRHGRKS